VSFDGKAWHTGRDSEKGWVGASASGTEVTVSFS
jgi:hypothetical protein